jgi:hypothetical protein
MESKVVRTWEFLGTKPASDAYGRVALEEHSDNTYRIPLTWFTWENLVELSQIIRSIMTSSGF